MSRGIAAVVSVLLLATPVVAGGLDEIQAGNDAFAAQRHEEALAAYTRALLAGDLAPEALATAYNNRGVVYNELGDYDRAIADFREALALSPGEPTVLRNLRIAYTGRGVALANFGEFQRALEDLGRAIELEPSHHLAWLRRAEVRIEMGDLEGAARDLAEAEARRPGDAEIAAAREYHAALEQQRRTREVATTVPAPAGSEAQGSASEGGDGPRASERSSAATLAAVRPEPPQGGAAAPLLGQAGELWRVRADVNVRAGPGNHHPVVRVARRGQTVQVIGDKGGWKETVFGDGAKGFVYKNWLEPVAAGGEEG